MRKILIGLAATVVLLLAAALIGPSFVDWNKFKPEIAERVKTATGRDLAIGGDISLSILPAPTLSAHNVTLANIPGAREPIMASLKSLGVRVELVPLFQGKIKVESLTLVEPVIALEALADGRHNWDLAPPAAAPAAGAAPKAAPPATPQPATESKTGGGEAIEIGSFSIENGTVTYRDDASGTTERIEKLNTEITAESLAGPISVDGDLVVHGIKLAIKAGTGEFTASPIPLHLDVSLPDADAKLSFGGSLSALNADGQITGKISAEGSDLSRLAALAQQGAKPAFPAPLAQKFSAAGDVSGSAKAIAIKDLKLALGDTLASGAVTVGIGPPVRIDITAAMTSLELDPWIASATAAKSETESDAGAGDNQKPGNGPPTAPSGAPTPPPTAAGFALPKTITATLDLSIGAAVYQRDLIRDVKLRAALDGGKLLIQQASASFPGGSSLSATGTLAGDGGKPAFDGSVAVLSDNLRGTFDWLKIDTSSVPAERLHKFAATGKIKGTPEQFELSGLDLKLDTSHMTGGVVVALRDKPALGVRFDLDQLDLDAYMPPPASAATAQPGTPAKSNPAPAAPSGNAAGGGLSVLKSFDANVVAKIGSLTARGMQIQNVAFDGTLLNGVLTARDLSAGDFGGGTAKLSGVLSGLGDKPAVDGAFAITVKDPARLMTLANRQPPPILTRLGPVGFSGNAKGALDAFSFDTALDIAGGKLTAQGTAGLPDSGAKFDIAVDAKHADLASLIRVYNPDYHPAAQNLGALALSLHLRGDTTAAELSDLKGNIGPVALQGGAHARFDGPRPAIDATLQASEIIADLFLPPNPSAGAAPPSGGKPTAGGGGSPALPPGQHWSKEPFDFTALKLADAEVKLTGAAISYGKYRVDKPEFVFSLKNGVLDIHDLKGAMFQGAFDLKGQLDASATPKLSGDVTISKADIHEALFSAGDIDVASGKLDFGMKAAGAGASPFDLVSSLAGNGTMQVTDGVVQGFDLKAISDRLKSLNSAMDFLAAFATSMSGGQTKFSKLAGTFTIDKGVVRADDVDLQAEAGAGKITGTIDLPAWMIDMRGDFTLTDHPKVPGFGMRVAGPLDSPERKLETKDLEAYLVQRGVGSLLKKVLPGEQAQPGAAPGAAPAKPLDQLLKKILPGQQPQPAPAAPATPAAPVQQPAAQPPAQTVPQQPAPPQPAPQAAPQSQQPQPAPAAPATPAAPAQQPAAQPQPAAPAAPAQQPATPAAPAQQPAAQPPTETAPAPQAPAQPESSQQSQPQKKQKGFNKLLQQLLQPPPNQPPPDQTAPTQTPGTQ